MITGLVRPFGFKGFDGGGIQDEAHKELDMGIKLCPVDQACSGLKFGQIKVQAHLWGWFCRGPAKIKNRT